MGRMVWMALSKCGFPFGLVNCPFGLVAAMCTCMRADSTEGWCSTICCFPIYLLGVVLFMTVGLFTDLFWFVAFLFSCGWKCRVQCGGGHCVVGKFVPDGYTTTEKSDESAWTKPAACCTPFWQQVHYISQQDERDFEMKRAAHLREDPHFDPWGTDPVPDVQEVRRQQELEEQQRREQAESQAIEDQIRQQQDQQQYTNPAQQFPTWMPPVYSTQPTPPAPPPPPPPPPAPVPSTTKATL